MTPEKWQQIKAIFNEAVELSPEEREAFLISASIADDVRAEVGKMFAADDKSLIQHSPFADLPETDQDNKMMPEKIGRYKVVREVGRGGMGAVYEAARDDGEFSQRVAVKIIKRGMDSDDILRRFRNERQILAELHHPNIARLFDGGVNDDGSPYYVMEFIEGAPIDAYCREKGSGIPEKLELFRQVCAAVSYAHSQLVVHRDLKPSNILITKDGIVKLLDFGIAKVLNTDAQDAVGTATQLGMMTPAYASPEQVRGEKVTTVSDVYSLGVVLYELLTGEKPYQTAGKSFVDLVDLICRTEPKRPSDTAVHNPAPDDRRLKNSALKGDLDNISLKSLQKEPARRYQSVEQFSEDIRRHLSGQTVSARADTLPYRLKKFVTRNKVTAVAGALIFLSLCAGITIALWQAYRAEHQRALAENRFSEVRELANAVIFKYHDAIAALPGSTAAREMLVKDATKYLDNLAEESAENPELQRELALAYIKLGDVQGKAYSANTGNTSGAVESYQKAVAMLESAATSKIANDEWKFDLVKAYEALFQIYMRTGDAGKDTLLKKALSLQGELAAKDPGNAAYKLQKAALLILSGDIAGPLENKLPFYNDALVLGEELFTRDPTDKEIIRFNMRSNQRLGSTNIWLGDEAEKKSDKQKAAELYARGLPFYERSFEMNQRLIELEPNNISYQRNDAMGAINLAESYAKNGKRAEALAMIDRCQKLIGRMESEDRNNKEIRSDVAFSHESIAKIWESLGDTSQQIAETEKAVRIQNDIFNDDRYNKEILAALGRNYRSLMNSYQELGDEKRVAASRQKLEEIKALMLEFAAANKPQ